MAIDRNHQGCLPRVGDEDGNGFAQSAVREEGKRRMTKRTVNGGVYIRPGGLDTVYK